MKRHRTLQVAQAFLKSRPPAGEGESVILAPRAVSLLLLSINLDVLCRHPRSHNCATVPLGDPLIPAGLRDPRSARLRRVTRFIGENAFAPP